MAYKNFAVVWVLAAGRKRGVAVGSRCGVLVAPKVSQITGGAQGWVGS